MVDETERIVTQPNVNISTDHGQFLLQLQVYKKGSNHNGTNWRTGFHVTGAVHAQKEIARRIVCTLLCSDSSPPTRCNFPPRHHATSQAARDASFILPLDHGFPLINWLTLQKLLRG